MVEANGDFRSVGVRLSNWGRWSEEDEKGTLNYIGSDQLIRAAGLVRAGRIVSLGIALGDDGPQLGSESLDGRRNPIHIMTELGQTQFLQGAFRCADDLLVLPLQAGTQWDALAHVHYDGKMYNGWTVSESLGQRGASRCSIEVAAKGIAGRGVLLDVAGYRGVRWLSAGDAVEAGELEDIARAQGVEILAGDILAVRTGWWAMFVETRSRRDFMAGEPGLGLSCAEWLHDHQVAAVVSDNFGVEAAAPNASGQLEGAVAGEALVLHMILVRDMGMWLGELFDLEELAADCRQDGIYEFFFCAPALRVTGGVASPLNPLAIK